MTNKELTSTNLKSRGAIFFILLVVFFDMLGVGIIIPVLVPLVGTLTSNPAEQAGWYALIIAGFAIPSFLAAPILGALSDSFGRKKLLLLGFFGFGLSFFATALTTSIWMLFIVRIVAGALEANIAIAGAYIADITTPDKRAQNYGLMGAAIGLGFVIGPAIGGILGSYSLHLPFYLAGSLSIINMIYGIFVLPESLAIENRRPFQLKSLNPLSNVLHYFKLPHLRALLIALSCGYLAQALMSSSWILFTEFKFSWTPLENGLSMFCMGIMMIITQGFTFKHLLKYFGYQKMCFWAAINLFVIFIGISLVSQTWMIFLLFFCNVIGNTLFPSIQGLISSACKADEQGGIMGVTSSLNSLSNILGPLIGPVILAYFVKHGYAKDSLYLSTPLFLVALLSITTIPILYYYFKKHHNTINLSINPN